MATPTASPPGSTSAFISTAENSGKRDREHRCETESRKKSRPSKNAKSAAVASISHKPTSTTRSSSRKPKKKPKMSTEALEGTTTAAPAASGSHPAVGVSQTWISPGGAALTFQSAGLYLSRWCQVIGQTPIYESEDVLPEGYVPPLPSKKALRKALLGETDSTPSNAHVPGSMRVCTVNLPIVGSVRSSPWPNKALAKQSASFNAVKELYRLKEVDDQLDPTPSRPRNKAGADGMATKSKCNWRWESRKLLIKDQLPQGVGTGDYECQTTPEFWKDCGPLKPNNLYASILHLSPEGEGKYDAHPECRPMCLLTSKPLSIFEKSNDVEVKIAMGEQPTYRASMRVINGGKMETFFAGKLDQALVFTEKIMRAQCQRPLKAELDKVKWLFVPLQTNYKPPSKEKLGGKATKLKLDDISWLEVDAITDGALTLPFTYQNYDVFKREARDALVTAPSEMSRRSYVSTVRTDLRPESPHPNDPSKTIYQYLRKDNLAIPELTNPSQPILEVESACNSKNGSYITTLGLPSEQRVKQYLIPEFERRHCIPASIFRTATVLPLFMIQLESMMIGWEMSSNSFGSLLSPELALQAVSAPSSLRVPSWTYERLEILGDTLLKFIVTVHSFLAGGGAYSDEDMLKVWTDKHKLVSNKTLTATAIKLGLPRYIRDKGAKIREWIPRDWEIESVHGEMQPSKLLKTSHDEPEFRPLGDKLLADVVEAIIGASYGPEKSLDNVITTLLNLTVPLPLFKSWEEVKHVMPPATTKEEQKNPDLPAYMNFFGKKSSYEVMGYKFKDSKKFENVFSLRQKPQTRNVRERYKMLGNAVIDVHKDVIDHLLEKFPEEGPASLSNMKTFRTTEGLRSASAVEFGLVELLLDADEKTNREISRAAYFMVEAKAQTDVNFTADDELIGVHYWESVAVNHVIGSLVEILIGAILDDANFSLEPTKDIFDNALVPFLEKYCKGPNDSDLHPKGMLTRWMQKKGCAYWKLDVEGPKLNEGFVTCHGKEVARQKAFSTHLAVRNVCDEAIVHLRDENLIEELCDCPSFKKTLSTEDEEKVFGKKKRPMAVEV